MNHPGKDPAPRGSAGSHPAGSHPAGSHPAGSHSAGGHSAGGHSAGGHSTGSGEPRKHEPEEISSILSRWISRNRAYRKVGQKPINVLWSEAAGPELALVTRATRLVGGVLTVEVSSAPLLNELATYRRQELLARVRAREELRTVHEIRFRAGES